MQTHNHFLINLTEQKSKAKKRLKSIRQGDDEAFKIVLNYHLNPDNLTPDNIQLADVQFALARELGLPSWSKLKAHVEELATHRQAINNREQALDWELPTLHVRCGHDIQESLKTAGFKGVFLPMIDPLCIGPIPANRKGFLITRAQYVVDTLLPIMDRTDSVQDVAQSEQSNLDRLLDEKFPRIVFWVEHDSYDQLMLLRGLNLLAEAPGKTIEIIELNHFPGAERFIGMGQLPAEAIRGCWHRRKPVSAKLFAQAQACWKALTSSEPHSIMDLLAHHHLDDLPNISKVLIRHLQELPHIATGLSLTQQIALTVLNEHQNRLSVRDWFKQYQRREPLPFLGDLMFYALLLPLAMIDEPLFNLDSAVSPWLDQQVSITPRGIACLNGENRAIQDYWVGGMHVEKQTQWTWDHQHLSSLRQRDLS